MGGGGVSSDYSYGGPIEAPSNVEPNVFYEPLPATQPFLVVYECEGDFYPHFSTAEVMETFATREAAEELARQESESSDYPHYVVGCVSISSVPKPVPLKASTRALV